MSDDRFENAPVSRRRFIELSAVTGAALTLPGNAVGDAENEAFTAEYQFVLNHTPDDYRAPTLVRFDDADGPSSMASMLPDAANVHTTTEPEAAAYGQLTTAEATSVADLPEASEFQFSPGSNPFWRIGYYPLGVFPEPRRSVDFVGFEQLRDGLAELEDRYPDRINVRVVGQSPGHTNRATDRPDPKDMIVVEVTNDVQDREAFREKEKVFHSCSLHGLEAAGRETGARVVENVARGSEPDIEGNNAKIEPLLDDVVLLIGFTNPDGWAVRNPQYDSGWQVGGPGSPGDTPRVPAAPVYERGNAEVYDTNRQYPIVGGINPEYYPAYVPEDAGPDDVPSYVYEKVPDAAAFVEFFRNYENLNYGSDLHGGPIFNNFVLGLISQDQFDTRQLHELYEMCLVIDETLEAALNRWSSAGDVRTQLIGGGQYDPALYGVLPEQAFDYATIYDTIGYTVSGAMLDWMAHPEPVGLDMTTLDFEMAFSHMTGGNVYNPELLEMEVTGYRTAIRTITAFAVRNSDTPNTGDSFHASTESGGDTVAYVTSGRDALRRTDEDLVFDDGDGGGSGGGSTTVADQVAAGAATTVTHEVSDTGLHSLRVNLHAEEAIMDVQLASPDGEVVREFEAVTEDRVGGKCCGFPAWVVTDPEPGEWTVRVENRREVAQGFEASFGTLASSSTNPDPRSVEQWGGEGYEQLPYDVSPYAYFEDYDGFIEDGGSIEPVTVPEVAQGALVDGGYDHAVVIHDYGANADATYIGRDVPGYTPSDHPEPGFDETGYVDALDEFVDQGGNLVMTDTAVTLLGQLDNDLVSGDAISSIETDDEGNVVGATGGDVVVDTYDVARFKSVDDGPEDNIPAQRDEPKNLDHPLLTDARPIQNQLWKVAPLGYEVNNEAPMYLLKEAAFTEAANGVASVAGYTDGYVAAGSITESADSGRGVHVVSSLLPPSTQKNLHPFGLQDYTVTFLGNLIFTSALGWEQVRETADTTRRYGRGDEWEFDADTPVDEFTAAGSREIDNQIVTGREAKRVDLTVSDLSDDAEIFDAYPEEWHFLERFSDGEPAGDGRVSFGDLSASAVDEDDETFTYFVESPDGFDQSGPYSFGPAEAVAVDSDDVAEFAGQDDVLVMGADV